MKTIKWRKWNNLLHRDIGYLTVGLTLIFVISGIAVNHIHEWNPNYKITRETQNIQFPELLLPEEAKDFLLSTLKIQEEPESSFRPSPSEIHLFFEGTTVEANIATGEVMVERVEERAFLHDMNFLHLNHPKKLWTWISDLYALCLGFLAISGLFILKGKKGLTGRGKWLTGIGILIPILVLWFYK